MKTHQMPVFKPARRKRLHEEIVGQIRTLIDEGELKSGDKLPPERRLAELFGVSRHCLREAIRALEQQRIVTCRLGDGTYVLSGSEENLIEPFAEVIEQRREKLREILELRRLIEPQIASLAAVNATGLPSKGAAPVRTRTANSTCSSHAPRATPFWRRCWCVCTTSSAKAAISPCRRRAAGSGPS